MSIQDLFVNLNAVLPFTILMVWAMVLLLVDLVIPRRQKGITAALAALGLLVALVLTILRPADGRTAFVDTIIVDGFATFLNVIFLVSGILGVAVAYDYLKRMGIERGEYYSLLLFSITGMMLMAHAADLIIVFLALELLSIPLYVLSGFDPERITSEEAALKYFLLGAFSTGFVIYGVALIYGATGSTNMSAILATLMQSEVNMTLLAIGTALVLIGLGFKVAAVPFHMWTPDVYQGAPTAIVAFMAVGAKAGGFAALLRLFFIALPQLDIDMTPILWGVAALTMILGNVVAIAQSNMKRLLAYSSIAHAGYILMALVPMEQEIVAQNAVASALFYLLAYGVTSFAAWAVVIALEQAEGYGLDLRDYAGLGRKYPIYAAAMAIAMFSFAGVPPTIGFVGKFYLFRTVLEGGFVWLAVIGVLTSVISAFYYLRVVIVMYMQDGEPTARTDPWLYLTAAGSAAAAILLIVFSEPLFHWASSSLLGSL
ncbi:MAG: NADH-quinone oxidoreductase subunit N [Chloroflexi bacterium]|nr:NADH-quinone oxidoreductase subunit N [Chloroflexota bacterium]